MQTTGAIYRETERRRIQSVVQTLAAMKYRGGTIAEVAHDARNMVTALVLYCDLLSEPGVLSAQHLHFVEELRLISAATRRLVEKLTQMDASVSCEAAPQAAEEGGRIAAVAQRAGGSATYEPGEPMVNFREEVLATHNLLNSIAGHGITVTTWAEQGARPVRLSSEDLTRILVNLVKNATEVLHSEGRIDIRVRELVTESGVPHAVELTVEDNGPGIPEDRLERIFEAGWTTKVPEAEAGGGEGAIKHGQGLAIIRSMVEAAGGSISASNRSDGGAQFEIVLPIGGRSGDGKQV